MSSAFYVFKFYAILALTFWGMWLVDPRLVYFVGAMLALHAIGINWATRILLALDQLYGTIWGPLALNWGVPLCHKFGDEDETVSSVIGKNINSLGGWH